MRQPINHPHVTWCPDVHAWQCIIRGKTHYIRDRETVEYIFDINSPGDEQLTLAITNECRTQSGPE